MNQPITVDYTPVCAWCLQERNDTSIRTGSHGICPRHAAIVLAEAKTYRDHRQATQARKEEQATR